MYGVAWLEDQVQLDDEMEVLMTVLAVLHDDSCLTVERIAALACPGTHSCTASPR